MNTKTKKLNKKNKIILIVLLGVLLLAGIIYLGADIYLDYLLNNLNKEGDIKEEDAEIHMIIEDNEKEPNEVVNFLLVGADGQESIVSRESATYNEMRADATKIISLDYTTKKIKISSLERDVVVFIAGDYQNYGHLNWAYWFGGAQTAVKTVNYNLDLDITKYVTISFAGFVDIIDELGGIDVELTTNEAKYLGLNTGINHLDGYYALLYASIRKIDSDFVRVDRQNTVIKIVIDKLKNIPYNELLNVVNGLLPYITTNLSNDEIKAYLMDIISFDLNDIQTHTWPSGGYNDIYNCPNLGGYLLKSYEDQLIELHKFIWEVDDYTPSDVAKKNIENIYNLYGKYE